MFCTFQMFSMLWRRFRCLTFAYMDVSWAHSVLQLCAEKTLSKLSVLILGFGRYSPLL